MNSRQIADWVIERFRRRQREWLDECILEALADLYCFDELSALERLQRVKERVRERVRYHVADCNKRGIPPKIRLSNDVITGKSRPEHMDSLEPIIRNMDPFEFQRVCCLYLKKARGIDIEEVRRQDHGADIIGKKDAFPIVAQARRHQEGKIGRNELWTWVLKAKEYYPGGAFLFVSANLFTKPARTYAFSAMVSLVDGEQIAYFLSTMINSSSAAAFSDWLSSGCQSCHGPQCDIKPNAPN